VGNLAEKVKKIGLTADYLARPSEKHTERGCGQRPSRSSVARQKPGNRPGSP